MHVGGGGGGVSSAGGILLNQPICIDNGSSSLKAGFSGEDKPKCVFQSCIGRPKYQQIMSGSTQGEYIGSLSQEKRGLLKLKYPIENGIVNDWDDMEKIWRHVYSSELKSNPEEHPVLITESPLNPRKNRRALAQVLFEQFSVPSLFVSNQAMLSLYASGRTTGIVLDSGDGVTSAVPIYEGFSIQQAVRRSNVAGNEVTEYLRLLLGKYTGHNFVSSSEKEIVREIKEKSICISKENIYSKHAKNPLNSDTSTYCLPDGQSVVLNSELNGATEVLFDPELIGVESLGMQHQILDSLSSVDIDLRKLLFSNIYLAGGTTLTKGFGHRLLSELKSIAPKDTKIKIYAPPERMYTAWIGASILSNLSTFQKMLVTYEEYKEDPDIIFRNCL